MKKVTIVIDNIRSAFNVGSIFRTADGLSFDINLIGITPIPHQDKKLDKTSLSALDSVEWKYFDSVQDWHKYISIKKDQGELNLIISVEETKDFKTTSLFNLNSEELNKFQNIYLVFGHEINGVSKFILEKSDKIIAIPMFGKKNSLNVATCVGILGYKVKELLRS